MRAGQDVREDHGLEMPRQNSQRVRRERRGPQQLG